MKAKEPRCESEKLIFTTTYLALIVKGKFGIASIAVVQSFVGNNRVENYKGFISATFYITLNPYVARCLLNVNEYE